MSALSHTLNPALQRLGEVSVRLSVELGRTQMALKDVLSLAEGSIVSLDKLTDELLDITANGQVIAHGEVIAQDGKFALRIVSLAGGDEPVRPPHGASAPRPAPSSASAPDAPANFAPEVPSPDAPHAAAGGEEFATAANGETVPAGDPSSEAASAPTSAPDANTSDPGPDSGKAEVDPLLDALDELTDTVPPGEDGAV